MMGLHQGNKKHVNNTAKPQKCKDTPAQKRLDARRRDYSIMIGQQKIGDGHRDATGYHRPGSNKK